MSMKTPKEILTAIKAIFSDQPLPEPVAPVSPVEPVQLEAKEYSLADGTKVMIDKLEVGGMVTLNDAPAPAAEYTLADGSSVTTDVSGIITEVSAAEPAIEPEVPEAAPAPAAPTMMRDDRVDALQAELSNVKQGFAQLVALVEQLAETPSAEPIEPQKTKFGMVQEDRHERISRITKALTQIKNK